MLFILSTVVQRVLCMSRWIRAACLKIFIAGFYQWNLYQSELKLPWRPWVQAVQQNQRLVIWVVFMSEILFLAGLRGWSHMVYLSLLMTQTWYRMVYLWKISITIWFLHLYCLKFTWKWASYFREVNVCKYICASIIFAIQFRLSLVSLPLPFFFYIFIFTVVCLWILSCKGWPRMFYLGVRIWSES